MSPHLTAQNRDRFWVYLQDKDTSIAPALSPKKIAEKKGKKIDIDWDDIPVNPRYVSAIKKYTSISVRHHSRWLNAVSIEGNIDSIQQLATLTFVKNIVPIHCHQSKPTASLSIHNGFSSAQQVSLTDAQKDMNVPLLWRKGMKGKGVNIAVFDDGFKAVRNQPRSEASKWFRKMKIKGWYDFAGRQKDVFHSGNHGTFVSSLIGGRLGKHKATAYQANFYLARTEDTSFERNIEEDNWVAAAEWADSIGIHLIHTSLNYAIFDKGEPRQYSNQDKDGHTAIITLAANKAFSKGIIVVCSAGNEGHEGSTSIAPPCDGFGSICVGSIDRTGKLSSFSSKGPTSDGRIKPDVVCFGENLFAFNSYFGDGTSYAAPQISGFVGAILQKYKTKSIDQIKECLLKSSNNRLNPDNQYGFGLPDGKEFINLLMLHPKQ